MNLYEVHLEYENIESGGSQRFTSTYYLRGKSFADALNKGVERLGSNRDGRLFSVLVKQIFEEPV